MAEKKKIAVALQGGGAHGAFTWGVLDKLLESDLFEIEGATGTSAGGMNAIALAQGLAKEGPDKARQELKEFWYGICQSGKNSALNNRGLVDKMMHKFTMYNSPGFLMFDYLSRIFSPYELNPMGFDPLKDVIQKHFDFDIIRNQNKCKVFLCATHVFTGTLKVFKTSDLKIESLLATACLPTIHSAVLVDGEYYWDGGFIGNPVFFPLIEECGDTDVDIVFIQLNPSVRNKLPTTSREIADRLNEITNNASVVREIRAIDFISRLRENKHLTEDAPLKKVRLHLIEDESTFQDLGWSSKLNTEWEFLTHLFEKGRQAAAEWIKKRYDDVGEHSTIPMRKNYLGEDFGRISQIKQRHRVKKTDK